jgi:pyridinium-3,5-biscarboxylic acid mononucleotide sulfurtransferase
MDDKLCLQKFVSPIFALKYIWRIMKFDLATIKQHLESLRIWFEAREKVIVALSGGVDSCLVAFLARKFLGKERAIAVTSHSASLKTRDLIDARNFCRHYDIHFEIVDAKEIEDENYASNPVNRCYFCKTALYSELISLIADKFKGYTILNGNNFSDFGDYRPGLQAAAENAVLSPLADCKMVKEDIRKLANHFNLFVWDKPASPCLSSRFPYGEAITIQKLRMVEKAEDLLHDAGFNDSRVRYFNNVARIEVPQNKLGLLKQKMKYLSDNIITLGFSSCEIDEEGLVSGKLNRILNVK